MVALPHSAGSKRGTKKKIAKPYYSKINRFTEHAALCGTLFFSIK
jgi:hypothetical protein